MAPSTRMVLPVVKLAALLLGSGLLAMLNNSAANAAALRNMRITPQ